MGFFTRRTILFNSSEVTKRKRKRTHSTPYGFVEFVLDFAERYKCVFPREHNIRTIVEAAAFEWEQMSELDKAPFWTIADEKKEYKEAADLYWKQVNNNRVETDSDSESY